MLTLHNNHLDNGTDKLKLKLDIGHVNDLIPKNDVTLYNSLASLECCRADLHDDLCHRCILLEDRCVVADVHVCRPGSAAAVVGPPPAALVLPAVRFGVSRPEHATIA